MRGSAQLGVLVYPVNANPYQRLLYRAIRATTDTRVYFVQRYPKTGSLHLLFIAMWLRLVRRYSVLHLHWPAFQQPSWLDPSGRWTVSTTRFSLWFIRRIGFRIVWTVHNVAPHEQESSDDAAVARLHARSADVVIVHSDRALAELRRVGLTVDDAVVIPHGNYIGWYSATETRLQTRTRFGISPNSFVFLFLGLVRPYKGVPLLVQAFLAASIPDSALVIAGEVSDPALRVADPRVLLLDRYLADEEVANMMGASDVACLPFLTVSTSGSAVLALSMSKPLIAARAGDLSDLPQDAVWLFEPGDVDELAGLLKLAAATDAETLDARRRAARSEAERRDWHRIAVATAATYVGP